MACSLLRINAREVLSLRGCKDMLSHWVFANFLVLLRLFLVQSWCEIAVAVWSGYT